MLNKTHNSEHRKFNNQGFALLFAVLATSVLLSISVSIWNIALREVVLSSFGRESQVAFYVADSAIECALYWDFVGNAAFATSTDTRDHPPASRTSIINCTNAAGGEVTPVFLSGDSLNAVSQFRATVGTGCATVYVTKTNPLAKSNSSVKIESYGQSTLCFSPDPTTVERGLRVTY